jgi:hypothetical protein
VEQVHGEGNPFFKFEVWSLTVMESVDIEFLFGQWAISKLICITCITVPVPRNQRIY